VGWSGCGFQIGQHTAVAPTQVPCAPQTWDFGKEVLPALETQAGNPVEGVRGGGGGWLGIRGLLADACSQEGLNFLSTTDVRRRAPVPAEEDAQSEAPECALSISGQAWAEGKGRPATSHLRADSGRETADLFLP